MKTVTQYKEEINLMVDSIAEIRDLAVNENRDLTISEANKLDEVLDEIEMIERLIQTEERTQTKLHRLSLPGKPLTLSEDGDVDPDTGGARPLKRDKDKFFTLGEQLAAVMRASSPGQSTDPRLLQAENRATGLGEGVASDGGFLIQDNFAQAMVEKVFQTGLLAQLCRQMPISVGTNMKIPGVDETSRVAGSRWGGVRGYWADEATQKTASQPKFRQIELNLHKLIGLCYATDELMSDARALESYIREAFADEFGFLIDDAIINGTGAGQPLGILNAGCVVSVAKETGQAADTIVYENVLKMYARLIANARNDSRWLINQDCEPQLGLMSLAVGTGGAPVYLPAGGASGSPYSTLMGRPVMPIEQCQTVGTTGDIYLASFGKGYIYSQKGGMQSDMSIHVRFVYDESVFRFVLRIDGQPLMRSAITPYKGNDDLSHFVKLNSRD